MAGKRSATSDLNHENWNKEEEPEEAGTFKKASDDVIKTRVIKTAKRRNPISSVRSEGNNTAFQAFTGFSKAPTPTSNAFSFLSNLSKPEQPKTNGMPQTNDSSATSSKVTTFTIESNKKPTTDAVNVSKQTNIKSDDYYAKLKGLNESVSKWIKQHVDENPFVSLQPIFKDYEKYFEELENECKNSKNDESTATSQAKSATDTKDDVTSSSGFASFAFKPANKTPLEKPAEKANPTWSFGVSSTTEPKESSKLSNLSKESKKSSTVTEMPKFTFGSASCSSLSSLNKSEAETPKFTFGSGNSNASPSSVKKSEAEAPNFSFGTTATTTPATTTASAFQLGAPTFSFGATTPSTTTTGFSFPKPSTSMPGFTFTNVSKPESSENNQNEEEDEEPPKNDFTPVVEEGHVYTTKCKVFVKKDKSFTDRGVGNLYLKPVPDSEKTQLIVRADTNLGNLLCNFLLSDSIPMQRMGKKDVMLVCLPMPDFKPPPVPILLRVKSPEDADELLETLEKYKK